MGFLHRATSGVSTANFQRVRSKSMATRVALLTGPWETKRISSPEMASVVVDCSGRVVLVVVR